MIMTYDLLKRIFLRLTMGSSQGYKTMQFCQGEFYLQYGIFVQIQI